MSVLLVFSGAAYSQSRALSWGKPDAAGLAAWRVVAEETPDLAEDAKKIRFDPRRGLRQITFDLDGDGRPEVFISGDIDSFCGSAGCMTFVLTREGQKWKIVCQTYAHYGRKGGDIRIGAKGGAGWRHFTATSRVTWVKDADGAVACEEQHSR